MAPVSISVSNVAVAGSSILADGKATVNTVKKRLPLSNHVRWEHMLAGVAGGVVSTVVLHPLDLIKIRFQVNEGQTVARHRPQYNGIFDAVRRIRAQEGVRGLYKGIVPNVWGAGMAWGFYFLFYNSTKTRMQESAQSNILGPGHHMTAAAAAGVATLIITNPVWVAKTRLCLQYDQGVFTPPIKHHNPTVVQYNGTLDCIYKIHKYEGVRGLYKGFTPGLFGVSHGALQFMAYEELKKMYNGFRERPLNAKFNTLEYLSFAALSKIFAAGLTYPYQVVRSRLQDQHRSYTGLTDVLKQTWRSEGVLAFYKGIFPNLLRVTPACCITFVVYENMIKWLGLDQPQAYR